MRLTSSSLGTLILCLQMVAVGTAPVAAQGPKGPTLADPGLALDPSGPLPETLNEVSPQVHVDGRGHVYRLWVNEWAGQGRHIQFQRSADGGRTWLPAQMLDRDKPQDGRSAAPAFAVDAGRLYTVWRMRRDEGSKHLQFAASTDQGVSWTPARALNEDGAAFSGHVAAPGDGHVYVVWYDERRTPGQGPTARRSQRGLAIYFNHSADAGRSWLPRDVRVSGQREPAGPGTSTVSKTEPPEADSTEEAPDAGAEGSRRAQARRARSFISAQPRIQADLRGRVFVAWMDTREGMTEIYFRASLDHGQSWGPEINVSRGGNSAREHQILTDGEGRVFLVWTDNRDGTPDVFFSRSEDGGAAWDAPRRLSRRPPGISGSLAPNMAIGPDGRLYVAWQDQRKGREDVYLNMSGDRGKTWLDQDVRLDRDEAGTGISRHPRVVVGGPGVVAVVWEDDRTGFEQILLTHSMDGGRTWLAQEIRVDGTTGPRLRARNPHAVWDRDGALHVVWEQWAGAGRDAKKRVEYRRLVPLP